MKIDNEIILKSRILNCIEDVDLEILVETMKLKREFN